jgi:hypothetical protein
VPRIPLNGMALLQDTNEVLFYKLLLGHIEEMAPLVYTPTVALACEQLSYIYRRPPGLFISYPLRDSIPAILRDRPNKDMVCASLQVPASAGPFIRKLLLEGEPNAGREACHGASDSNHSNLSQQGLPSRAPYQHQPHLGDST